MLRLFISSLAIFSLLHIGVPHVTQTGSYELVNSAHAETVTVTPTGDHDDTDDYMNEGTWSTVSSLIPFVFAAIQVQLLIKCWNVIDMWIAMAGMLIFVIWELINAFKFEGQLEEQELEASYDNIGEAEIQKEALQNVSDSYEDLVERYEARTTALIWYEVFSWIAFAVWAAFFIVNIICSIYGSEGCVDAVWDCKGLDSMYVPPSPNILNPKNSQDVFQLLAFDQSHAFDDFDNRQAMLETEKNDLFHSLMTQADSNAQSIFIYKEWIANKRGAIKSESLNIYQASRESINQLETEHNFKDYLSLIMNSAPQKMFNSIEDMLPAKAFAGDDDDEGTDWNWDSGLTLILGGAAGIALLLLVRQALEPICKVLTFKWTRGLLLGVYAVFASIGRTNTEDAKSDVEERKTAIDEIIAVLEAKIAEDTANDAGGDGPDLTTNPGNFNRNAISPTTKTPDKIDCGSSTDGSCPLTTYKGFKNSSISGLPGLDSTLRSAMTAANNTGNYYNNGDYDSAAASANETASYASAVKKRIPVLKEKINENLKKNKKKPIDFDGLHKSTMAKIKKAAMGAYNSLSPSQKSQLASSLGGAGDDKLKKKLAKVKAASTKAAMNKKEKGFNLDFSFLDDAAPTPDAQAETKTASNDDFEYNEGDDINKKSDVSIFKIIEQRYKKNAYPVFFEEEK